MVGFMAFMAFLALGLSHCPDGTAHSRHILQCEPSSCSIAHDEPLDIPRTSKDSVWETADVARCSALSLALLQRKK